VANPALLDRRARRERIFRRPQPFTLHDILIRI
jgi:hypothetical protein